MSSAPSANAAAPQPLRAVLNGIDYVSRLDGWLGALCLVSLTALMLAEVFVRAVSNVTSLLPASIPVAWVPAHIPVAWEWSSYLMAATFTFGAAMTLRGGGHIRVTLLLNNVPPAIRRIVEILCSAMALAFVGFLAYAMVKFTYGSFSRGQTALSSNTPVWIPQAVVTFGMFLLALQFLGRLIQAILGLPLEDHSFKAGAPAD
jgi:TRAP-type C4-dicarboxylate transport system permease small subunit